MRTKRRGRIRLLKPLPAEEAAQPPATVETIDRLRRERFLYDGVTGLPVHPFENPERAAAIERIEWLGVVYLQIGKFFGFEELHGWEQYDRILTVVADGIREDAASSRFAGSLLSIRFTGSDGFFVLFELSNGSRARQAASLEEEASRFQVNAMRRLRQNFGGATGDLMSVHVSSLAAQDDPRSRPSRHVNRMLAEAAKIVTQKQTRERIDLYGELKGIISEKLLKAAFQPVRRLSDGTVTGFEALIRGPQGSALERPSALFSVSHQNDMDVELESLCLETIFANLPRAVRPRQLFVNASATLLRHPIFLNARNLTAINKSHPNVVIEISEKEVVGDWESFRDILQVVRKANFKIAIDDAGSGYSGLETILYLRPDYIKIADSLVRHLETDPIKREIVSSLASIGRRIQASLIAEGIEREEECAALRDLGIEYGQGFLLGRPSFQASSGRRNGIAH
ncbi:MAG TPA: EAL domain-containing protein [Thermoanaerobaculia bacterium]|nr:EAL domain-containing protein [Thermoanaerobaculia bacterium]